MTDKLSFLIKDIIIYLIPGMLIVGCLIQLTVGIEFALSTLKENNLAIVGICFSYIIGFLSSQLQLIIFELISSNKKYFLDKIFKDLIITNKIIKKTCFLLNLEDNNDLKDLRNSERLRNICAQYINNHASEESLNSILRQKYLSTFSITIYAPAILSIYTILHSNPIEIKITFEICLVSALWLGVLIRKIYTNFESVRVRAIFLNFMIVNDKKEN